MLFWCRRFRVRAIYERDSCRMCDIGVEVVVECVYVWVWGDGVGRFSIVWVDYFSYCGDDVGVCCVVVVVDVGDDIFRCGDGENNCRGLLIVWDVVCGNFEVCVWFRKFKCYCWYVCCIFSVLFDVCIFVFRFCRRAIGARRRRGVV